MGVSTNVAGWTSDEVSTWLAGLGLGHLAAEFTKNAVNGEDLLSLSDADLTAHLGTTSLQTRKIRQGLSRLIAGGDAPGGAAGGGGGVAPLVQQAPPTPPAPMEDAKYDIDKSPTFSSFSPAASMLLDGVPAVAAAPQPPYMAGLASEGLGADSSAVVPILTRYLPAYCAILTALLVFAIADSVLLGQVIAKNKSNGYDDVCTSWCALSVTCNTFTMLSFLVLLPLQFTLGKRGRLAPTIATVTVACLLGVAYLINIADWTAISWGYLSYMSEMSIARFALQWMLTIVWFVALAVASVHLAAGRRVRRQAPDLLGVGGVQQTQQIDVGSTTMSMMV